MVVNAKEGDREGEIDVDGEGERDGDDDTDFDGEILTLVDKEAEGEMDGESDITATVGSKIPCGQLYQGI